MALYLVKNSKMAMLLLPYFIVFLLFPLPETVQALPRTIMPPRKLLQGCNYQDCADADECKSWNPCDCPESEKDEYGISMCVPIRAPAT